MIKARRAAAAKAAVAWAAIAALACVHGPSHLSAADPADLEAAARALQELRVEAERAREEESRWEAEAAALAEELDDVRAEAAAAAAAVAAALADVAALERQLRLLTQQESALAAALDARREEVAGTLMALQRLARLPPAAVLVHPHPPVEVAKAGVLLGAAVDEIERRAHALLQDLRDLQEARRDMESRRRTLDSAVARLSLERKRLDRLIAKRSELQAELASRAWDAAERGRRLAGQAGDAEVLVSQLRREEQVRQALAAAIAHHPPPPPSLRPDPDSRSESQRRADSGLRAEPELKVEARRKSDGARGRPSGRSASAPLAAGQGYPADGRIVVSFGDAPEGSAASKGITWETLSGARVVAPAAGTVAFAGPFRGYGLLLIVEHIDGYHSLLAGLERIDVEIGQKVRIGDSLGAMGHRGTGNLSLYMELRKDGHPVNPLPWLAAGKRKVSG